MGEEKNTDDVSKIIAAINPDKYYDYDVKSRLDEFKKLLKEDFWQAADKAKVKCPEEHMLVYDSSSETLEPVYFWILDKMNEFFKNKVEKLVDNFSSSAGSGHFAEMGARATKMQEEAMKIMQTAGILVKSLVNIVYDLKEFELRLSQYGAANDKDKNKAEAGLLALKQIWMDNVDIKRGRGSINMLAQDLQFVTIRDAFMIAKSVRDVKDLDLNDRVKRILEPRIHEFFQWKELSEKELKKRYEIEKSYLKSQVNSLKMYTRWVRPYLKAAAQLEMKDMKNPALVTAFNTMILQLSILGTNEIDVNQEIVDKTMPQSFRNKKMKRKYYSCVLVDVYFRGIPQRAGQNYVFGGRAEAKFRAFALNDEEIKMLHQKLAESDMNEALKLAEGMTSESLEQLKDDLEYFLKKPEERKKEEDEKKSEDVNPFAALFGFGNKKEEKKEEKKIEKIKPDDFVEKTVREIAQKKANKNCYDVFDIYKKAHDMASHPSPFD
ncbi:hypothetical protein FJZ19_05310 [Candidatus Pacearchaeota archaeon]|nr:hypothetical protein [Candidatus Pacearchaeota archaeon]